MRFSLRYYSSSRPGAIMGWINGSLPGEDDWASWLPAPSGVVGSKYAHATQGQERQERVVSCAWLHLVLHVRRIVGRGYLPQEQYAPVHCWLVLLRFGWIDHVGDALEELSINCLEREL